MGVVSHAVTHMGHFQEMLGYVNWKVSDQLAQKVKEDSAIKRCKRRTTLKDKGQQF